MRRMMLLLLMLMAMPLAGLAADAPLIPAGKLDARVMHFDGREAYPVYSAPDAASLRGAGGKASVNTVDWIQVFGREGDWLLVQYGVSEGRYRIGYIPCDSTTPAEAAPLSFNSRTVTLTCEAALTDDPLGKAAALCTLQAGDTVTWLSDLGSAWAYVESTSGGKRVRGFVRPWLLRRGREDYVSVSAPLFPAKGENGLWGYIDASGAFAIQPRFAGAGKFRGRYAIAREESDETGWHEGIIDTAGEWVVPPRYQWVDDGYDNVYYGGDDHGVVYLDEHSWFWLDTGYWSGETDLVLYETWVQGSVLALLQREDGSLCFMRMDNGQTLDSPALNTLEGLDINGVEHVFFRDGYLSMVTWAGAPAGEEWAALSGWYFGDECGRIVAADKVYEPIATEEGIHCGLAAARNKQTGRLGFLSAATGTIAIKPQYLALEGDGFNECGYAVVQLPEGDWAVIDTLGAICSRGYACAPQLEGDALWCPDTHILCTAEGTLLLQLEGSEWKPLAQVNIHTWQYDYLIGDSYVLLYSERWQLESLMKLDGSCPLPQVLYGTGDEETWPHEAHGLIRLWDRDAYRLGVLTLEGEEILPFAFDYIDLSRCELLIRARSDTTEGWYDPTGRPVYVWNR